MTTTRVRAVMDIVEEMYSEKDSLETTIEFGDNFPIIPKIENSWCDKVWSDIIEAEGELGLIARESEHEANAYIFFTADQAGGGLGIAGKIGSVCDPDRGERITISQYKEGQWKGPDMYTAEVNIIFINIELFFIFNSCYNYCFYMFISKALHF